MMRRNWYVHLLLLAILMSAGSMTMPATAQTTDQPSDQDNANTSFSDSEIKASIVLDKAWLTEDTEQQRKLYQEVVDLYTQALKENPMNTASIYNNRGLVYVFLEKYPEAIADFDAALQTEPRLSASVNNRGVVHQRQGNLRQARADFQLFLEITATVPPEASPATAARRDEVATEVQTISEQLGEPVEETDVPETNDPSSTDVSTAGNITILSTYKEWYGRDKAHNYEKNGLIGINAPGWTCGKPWCPWSDKSNVENIVYFIVDNGATSRSLSRWDWSPEAYSYLWLHENWYHNYTSATGWTPLGSNNYYALVPERLVWGGWNAPSSNHRITGFLP